MKNHSEMKKKEMSNTLKAFLERNQNYIIGIYFRSTATDTIIGRFHVPVERNYEQNGENGFKASWNSGNDSLCIPYNEVIASYEEKDEYGSQSVHVIMKSGIVIEFECVGDRI